MDEDSGFGEEAVAMADTAHRECLGHQEYFLIELFLVFCKLIWNDERALRDSRKIKKHKKLKIQN